MGLAVAMALFLLVLALVAAAAIGVGWGVARVSHTAFVAARGVVRRTRS